MSANYIRIVEGSAPILLDIPHSGTIGLNGPEGVPEIIAERVRWNSEAVRRTAGFGCDAAVPQMTGFSALAKEFGLSRVSNELARVWSDPNRDLKDLSGRAVEGYPPDNFPHGLLWARTVPYGLDLSQSQERIEAARAQFENVFDRPLKPAEFKALLAEVYTPYHAALQDAHKRTIASDGRVLHLALHSAPPVSLTKVDGAYVAGAPVQRGCMDLKKRTFPDVFLIHNDFQAADPRYIEILRQTFTEAGLIVEDGKGLFKGHDGVTGIYGNPGEGRNVIGIEHVAHGSELGRHLGIPTVNKEAAEQFQPVYRLAIQRLLEALA